VFFLTRVIKVQERQLPTTAAVFQNFESRCFDSTFWKKDTVRNTLAGLPESASFEGGFLLLDGFKKPG
jgi:hypothetical protein